jgi:hypothetical protein
MSEAPMKFQTGDFICRTNFGKVIDVMQITEVLGCDYRATQVLSQKGWPRGRTELFPHEFFHENGYILLEESEKARLI